MKPLISVIIPCYNCAPFLEETLQSVLVQTFQSFEIIIVNDGSKDHSLAIMKKYSKYDRITYITQENRGLPAARNAGIKRARGRFFYFLDSDDLLHPKAFQVMIDTVSECKISVGFMRVARFHGNINNIVKIDNVISHFWPDIIFTNLAPLNAFLFPAHLVHKVNGFNEKCSFAEDWEFLLRLAFAGAKLRTTDFVGAYYRLHSASMTKTYDRKKRLYGYLCLKKTLCDEILKRKDLLSLYGKEVFWSAWGTLAEAKKHAISWEHLKDLSKPLRRLAWNLVFIGNANPFIIFYAVFGARFSMKLH